MARLHTLSNGVRIVSDPIDGLETLALSVVIGRGARWETKATSGWSHLLEHMVFKGAGERTARDIVEVIEAEGGQINAATGYERTSFQIRALKGGLPLAMAVTSDLLLRPTLDAGDLEREKDVIAQEIAEAADTPDDLVFDIAQTAAFGDTSLGRPILGTRKSIGTATPQSLAAFGAGLYAPDRIVVSASGAVDENELLALTEQWFGSARAPKQPLAEPDAAAFVGGRAPKSRSLEQAHLVLTLPAPGARDDGYFALRLFAEALGGGMSSRLFQEAREKRGLAYNIDAYADTYIDGGVLGVYAGVEAANAAEAAKVSAQEIRALAAEIGEAELARAKAQLKAHLFMARESPLARAEQAAGQTLMFERLFATAEIAEAIDSVTAADMAALGQGLLSPRRSAEAVLGPKRAAAAVEAFERGLFE